MYVVQDRDIEYALQILPAETKDASALPCISPKGQRTDECTCMRMSSRNLFKCKQVVYCVFCLRLSLQSCCCLFIWLYAIFIYLGHLIFFILMLLLYYKHLFVNRVNKSIIFVLWAFVYHFKKIITIFVTLFYLYFSLSVW